MKMSSIIESMPTYVQRRRASTASLRAVFFKSSMLAALGSLFIAPPPAAASQIVVKQATASSTSPQYNLADLTNGDGLLADDLHSGDWSTKWLAEDPVASLTFDFGAAYELSSVKIWNYGGGCCDARRSAKDITISSSADGLLYIPQGAFTLLQSDSETIASQTFSLSGSARFVQLNILTNYVSAFSGLSEVQFFGPAAAAVPEASTWAMMLLGFGAVGYSMRSRKAGDKARQAV